MPKKKPLKTPRSPAVDRAALCSAESLCQCIVCKKIFQAGSITEAKRRKTCSYVCAAKLRWPQKPSRECVVCTRLFTPKRDEHQCCSKKCASEKMAATHRASGHRPPPHAIEAKLAAMRTPEHRLKMRKIQQGRIQKTAKSARESALHSRAAVFFVKSPANVTYLVMNITKFVSEHESLFPPDAVVWKWTGRSKSCRATIGLHSINKGHRGTWRGWMKVSDLEGKQNLELLPRTFVEQNDGTER